jgi:hypothetical protein
MHSLTGKSANYDKPVPEAICRYVSFVKNFSDKLSNLLIYLGVNLNPIKIALHQQTNNSELGLKHNIVLFNLSKTKHTNYKSLVLCNIIIFGLIVLSPNIGGFGGLYKQI